LIQKILQGLGPAKDILGGFLELVILQNHNLMIPDAELQRYFGHDVDVKLNFSVVQKFLHIKAVGQDAALNIL
jgi:hypothetical protein